jgi:xanthine dehydrogenase large subunit
VDDYRTEVGRAVRHDGAVLHATGRARYAGDLPLPARALVAWPVTSPHARARVVSINAEPALAVRGVATVLTAADVPGLNDTGPIRHDEPLFPSEVRHHAQAVAWVLAEDVSTARRGASLVEVAWEPFMPLLDLAEAIEAGSFHTEPQWMRRGDVDGVLAEASASPEAVVVEGTLQLGAQDHFPLETHVSLAIPESDGRIMVHSSTQHPSETQAVVAHVLGVSLNQVVVQCSRMGGGFGGKESQANAWAAVAAIGVAKTGRATLVRLDRDRHMTMTGKRHPFLARYRAAIGRAGLLRALDVELYSDGGWSLDLSDAVTGRAMLHVDNAYFWPAMRVRGQVVRTDKVSQTAFRGFGGPQGMAVAEEVIDRLARSAGLDPHDVRARNLYAATGDAGTTHYGEEIGDGRLRTVWSELETSSSYTRRRAEVQAWNASPEAVRRRRRRGLAMTPVKFGISFTTTFLNQAGALVNVLVDGSVQVHHGGTEMGQGLHVKLAQVAADALGVALPAIRMMATRTDIVPNTSATAASSGTDLNGGAIVAACATLRARMAPVAASLLSADGVEVAAAEVQFHAGAVSATSRPGVQVTFADVARAAHRDRVSLSATGFYRTPNIWFDRETGKGRPFAYFACGAAVTEVEIDGFTGEMHLRRVDILHDAGASINPLVDIGQVEGGFVQGMGWVTMEEVVWDASGRILTHAPSTYKIPAATDIPSEWHVSLLPRAAQPGVVAGGKAVGEPPFMLALSVREAIRAAVAAFAAENARPSHVEVRLPATAEAILDAIDAIRG